MKRKRRRRIEQRVVTSTEMDRQRQGGQYIAPGVWLDREGHAHFSVPEILAHLGIADTPEDRALCTHVVSTALREVDPNARIIREDPGPDA